MQTIYLDISNKGTIPVLHAKQGDVGRKFLAVISDAGVPYIIPKGSSFSIWYEGKSGSGNYTHIDKNPAIIVDKNKVYVELITQMLQNEGCGIICLVLNNSNGNQISSWNIEYCVEYVPGINSEPAEDYYTAFSQTVEKLLDVVGKLNNGEYQNQLTWLTEKDLDAMWNGTYEGVEDEDNNGFVKNKVFVDSATGDLYQLFVQNGELKMKEAE